MKWKTVKKCRKAIIQNQLLSLKENAEIKKLRWSENVIQAGKLANWKFEIPVFPLKLSSSYKPHLSLCRTGRATRDAARIGPTKLRGGGLRWFSRRRQANESQLYTKSTNINEMLILPSPAMWGEWHYLRELVVMVYFITTSAAPNSLKAGKSRVNPTGNSGNRWQIPRIVTCF